MAAGNISNVRLSPNAPSAKAHNTLSGQAGASFMQVLYDKFLNKISRAAEGIAQGTPFEYSPGVVVDPSNAGGILKINMMLDLDTTAYSTEVKIYEKYSSVISKMLDTLR